MRRPELEGLERALLEAGVAPRFVYRTLSELADHCDDIEADALASGASRAEAARLARHAIGNDADIVAAVSAQRELLCWPCRWPRSAHCIESLCYYALLPAAPFVYCAERGSTIARWSLSTSLALLVTGTLLFSLQWFVAVGAAF